MPQEVSTSFVERSNIRTRSGVAVKQVRVLRSGSLAIVELVVAAGFEIHRDDGVRVWRDVSPWFRVLGSVPRLKPQECKHIHHWNSNVLTLCHELLGQWRGSAEGQHAQYSLRALQGRELHSQHTAGFLGDCRGGGDGPQCPTLHKNLRAAAGSLAQHRSSP